MMAKAPMMYQRYCSHSDGEQNRTHVPGGSRDSSMFQRRRLRQSTLATARGGGLHPNIFRLFACHYPQRDVPRLTFHELRNLETRRRQSLGRGRSPKLHTREPLTLPQSVAPYLRVSRCVRNRLRKRRDKAPSCLKITFVNFEKLLQRLARPVGDFEPAFICPKRFTRAAKPISIIG